MNIRLASPLAFDSIVDGPGLRCVVWCQGCLHNCPGCHNPETQPMDLGNVVDTSELILEIQNSKMQTGITFSGGEPFLQATPLIEIALAAKECGLNIWAYSGYTIEEIFQDKEKFALLKHVDVLVDGRFIQAEKNFDLKFKGSKNQRIIDVQASLFKNEIVLFNVEEAIQVIV